MSPIPPPAQMDRQSTSASYKTAKESPKIQPVRTPDAAPIPAAAVEALGPKGKAKEEVDDILEMAAKGDTNFFRKANPQILDSKVTKPLQIATGPTGLLDPTRGKVAKKFRSNFEEPGHKKMMSYFTEVESISELSVKERAEMIHSLGASTVKALAKPNDKEGDKITIHGGTAYVLGTSEVKDATVGDVAALVAGDPVAILPELRGVAHGYNLLRDNSTPVIAAKVIAATRFDLDFEQNKAILELEKTVCGIIRGKLQAMGWFDRNYGRTEESLRSLGDKLNTDICKAVYKEAKQVIATDAENLPSALQMIALGSQGVLGSSYVR